MSFRLRPLVPATLCRRNPVDLRAPMTDTLTRKQRSLLMAKVRSTNTQPEWVLRSALHRLGFRYRLHAKDLPGRPDLVFPRYRVAIFIHGCFWHRHPGCKDASSPKTNQLFWERKFCDNIRRDREVAEALTKEGWEVVVVWECELLQDTLPTIERVREILAKRRPPAPDTAYPVLDLSKRSLLAIAEKKSKYRAPGRRGKRA